MYLPRASSILNYSKFSNKDNQGGVSNELYQSSQGSFFSFRRASLANARSFFSFSPTKRPHVEIPLGVLLCVRDSVRALAPRRAHALHLRLFSGEKGAAETDAQRAVVLRFPLHFHTVFLEPGVPSIHSPPNFSFRTSSTNSQ